MQVGKLDAKFDFSLAAASRVHNLPAPFHVRPRARLVQSVHVLHVFAMPMALLSAHHMTQAFSVALFCSCCFSRLSLFRHVDNLHLALAGGAQVALLLDEVCQRPGCHRPQVHSRCDCMHCVLCHLSIWHAAGQSSLTVCMPRGCCLAFLGLLAARAQPVLTMAVLMQVRVWR